MPQQKITKTILFLSLIFSLISPELAIAAPAKKPVVKDVAPVVVVKDPAYAAKFTGQNDTDPIEIVAGKSKTVVFTFKNTGTATWDSTGKRFISAYTMEPRNRVSIFASSDWINSHQTGRVVGKIKPGQSGKLAITFKAPKIPGEYTEKFYLSSENHSWVKGGYFFAKIKVLAASGGTVTPTGSTPAAPEPTPSGSSANRIFLNPKQITAVGSDPVIIKFGYQNISKTNWTSESVDFTSASPVGMADGSWTSRTQVMKKDIITGANDFLRDSFILRAPSKAGTYTASFTVTFNTNQTAQISIPITVTADAPSDYQEFFPTVVTPPNTTNDFSNETPRLAAEPNIRVGIWKNPDNNTVRFISSDDDYTVYTGAVMVGTLSRSTPATLQYAGGLYTFSSDLLITSSTQFLRLVPVNLSHSIFTLTNYSRPYNGRNYNQYRGTFELRLAQDQNQSLYGINELLFEDYMAGMGENSNNSPLEYLKSQAVAQRTYAYYTQQNTGKHDSRNFDVVANTGDQLYLGVGYEPLMSRFLSAVNATRGLMVTYNNNVVVTPYYGNSDGRTRSWAEVWGGNKPWLASVPATYDARDGKKMFGHGVGMSQRDAAIRADEEGIDFVALLKYYYTGTEVHKIYP